MTWMQGSYSCTLFQAKNSRTFQGVARTLLWNFKDLFSKNLPQAKQNALFGFLSFSHSHDILIFFQPFFIQIAPARHCETQLNPQNKYRYGRKRELQNMCKPDMCCALVAQCSCVRVMREHWEPNSQAFLRILWAFRGCYTLFTWTFVFTDFHLL